MSAGGTAATCETTSCALPLGNLTESYLYTVTNGAPDEEAGKCATTSALEPSLIEKVCSRTFVPFSLNVTIRLPGLTLNGPATAAVLTPSATDSPSLSNARFLPGRPLTVEV